MMEEQVRKRLGNIIKELAVSQGIYTDQQLAEMTAEVEGGIKMSRTKVNEIVIGKAKTISFMYLWTISVVLGVDVDWLASQAGLVRRTPPQGPGGERRENPQEGRYPPGNYPGPGQREGEITQSIIIGGEERMRLYHNLDNPAFRRGRRAIQPDQRREPVSPAPALPLPPPKGRYIRRRP